MTESTLQTALTRRRLLKGALGFDADGNPRRWPMPLAKAHWAALLPGLPAGEYTLRCRTIDATGAARTVIAEVNARMPFTHGDSTIPFATIDAYIETDRPLHTVPRLPVTEEQAAIGRQVASLIDDGATLQLGIGAIPAEGGLGWGVGRFLTSRRWFRKHTTINYDKIICWEHPNFADRIITELNQQFECLEINYWPFGNNPVLRNFNLICSFKYKKSNNT